MSLKERLLDVRQNINKKSSTATLIAVSKYQPVSKIKEFLSYHQTDFGENYIQELERKSKELQGSDINWHFIGKLQSNKLKSLAAIPNLKSIQTLEKLSHAKKLDELLTKQLDIFIQINTSNEDNKGGLGNHSSELDDLIAFLKQSKHLNLIGLMTIGSLKESTADSEVNNDFMRLVDTRNTLNQRHGLNLKLSMGMSADYIRALDYQSDFVRVGSLLFGERPQKHEL